MAVQKEKAFTNKTSHNPFIEKLESYKFSANIGHNRKYPFLKGKKLKQGVFPQVYNLF